MKRRIAPLLASAALSACVALTACAALPEVEERPYPSFVGPAGVEAWRSVHALFYIVPVTAGVLLFDTGYDNDGGDLLEALGGRSVHAVFITHGHADHFAGAQILGPVPTFAGEGDLPRIRGDEGNTALLPSLGDRFLRSPSPPPGLVGIKDGREISAAEVGAPGDWSVRAIAMPGHTPGSTAYRIGNLLFTGDAVLGAGLNDEGKPTVGVAPSLFAEDEGAAKQAVAKLYREIKGTGVRFMFDGHIGRLENPELPLAAFSANLAADN